MFVSVRSVWKSIIRIGRGLPLIPVAIIMVFFMFSAFGEYIAPHEATAQVLLDRLKPPDWTGEGTKSHLLGTDELGRDQLSRLIVGARASCIVALATLFVGGILGGMIGLVSGYLGGRVDSFVMRVADGVLAFPSFCSPSYLPSRSARASLVQWPPSASLYGRVLPVLFEAKY